MKKIILHLLCGVLFAFAAIGASASEADVTLSFSFSKQNVPSERIDKLLGLFSGWRDLYR